MTNVLLQSMQNASWTGELPKFQHLDDRYKCEICKDVLRIPMTTVCGHRLCKQCATNYIIERGGESAKCPANLEDCSDFTLDSLVPDFGTHRDLQKLNVYCPNNRHGCNDLIPWGKLNEHTATCQFALEDCINKGFGCKQKISRAKLKEHLDRDCEFRTKQCEYCEALIPERLMEEHLHNSCPAMSIICPYKCGEQSIQRKELDQHKKICRARPKDCKYKAMGCDFTGSEEEVRRHEANDSAAHVEKLFNRVVSLEKTNAELINKLQEHTRGATAAPVSATPPLDLDPVKQRVQRVEKKQQSLDEILKRTSIQVASMHTKVENISEDNTVALKNELYLLKETVEKLMEKSRSSSDPANDKIQQLDRSMGLCNMRQQEMDLRLQCVETASYDGTLIWKIRDYKRRKEEAKSGRTMSLYSQPFYTHRYGYKACARVYLNGDGMGKNTHMSLFFVILRGDFDALLPWPFRQKVTMTLLDQEGGKKNIVDSFRADPTSNSFKRPTSDMNIASGCPLFAAQTSVESVPFLKDDCIFLQMNVNTDGLDPVSAGGKSGSFEKRS